jgi:hypothetical protein
MNTEKRNTSVRPIIMDATVPTEGLKCGHCGHPVRGFNVRSTGLLICSNCHRDLMVIALGVIEDE